MFSNIIVWGDSLGKVKIDETPIEPPIVISPPDSGGIITAGDPLMATEKWIAGSGAGFTWTNATTAGVLDNLASGSAILTNIDITNQTALDIFCDVSLALGSVAVVAPNFVGLYVYPLNKDGTTYGDGRFASSAAGPPAANYYKGYIQLVAATQAQVGSYTGIIIPPGTFRFVVYNQAGVAWTSGGANTFQYRTYNRSVA